MPHSPVLSINASTIAARSAAFEFCFTVSRGSANIEDGAAQGARTDANGARGWWT
jgi:hypothetical protein